MAVNEHDEKTGPDEAGARIATLYRDASGEEPPARLDRVIARAARAPVGRVSAPQRVPWWLAWRVPFAVAALAVVSVSLVTLMVEEDADRVTRIPPPSPAASESAPAEKEMRSVPAPAPAPGPRTERAVEPAEARREDARTSEGRAAPDAAAMRAPMSEGPPPAEAAAADTRMRASQKAPSADAAPSAVYDAAREPARDVALPPPPPRLEGPGTSIDDRAGVAPQAARRSAVPAAKPASPGSVQAPAPSPAAKPAPAPPATIGIRGLESEAVSLARASPEVAKHLVELDREPPAAWIERVLVLRKQGRFAEAEGVLAEFRQRYPRVPLPPDLQ